MSWPIKDVHAATCLTDVYCQPMSVDEEVLFPKSEAI